MDVYLYAVVCKEVKDGQQKMYLLFDEMYPILAKDEKDAISKATLTFAGDLEEAKDAADGEGKEFSYEVHIRAF